MDTLDESPGPIFDPSLSLIIVLEWRVWEINPTGQFCTAATDFGSDPDSSGTRADNIRSSAVKWGREAT